MKIAIHHREKGFSGKWIEYCENNQIPYKLVNCFDTDIIRQLQDCDGLMWHWSHSDVKAALMARQLTLSLEKAGKKVFPDSNTAWHYDDKLGQKYLLESINAPLVPTYVFYNKKEALAWAANTIYPKVFKTRSGAGSSNVRLIKNQKSAQKIINKCFGKGIPSFNKYSKAKDKIWQFRRDKNVKALARVFKYGFKALLPSSYQPQHFNEKYYAYFQDFIPGNDYDSRVYVIADKLFTTIRYVRKNDFRASGSGIKSYDPKLVNKEVLKIALEISRKLSLQVCAFDFVIYKNSPLIVEISYCFGKRKETGFWDEHFNWYNERLCMQHVMIENFLKEIQQAKSLKNC